jgi:hypothetical protein
MTANRTQAPARVRWWVHGDATPTLERLLADPDGVLHGPSSVARARTGRKRFYRVAAPAGEPALYVKVFHPAPGLARLATLLRRSRAQREADVARAVAARGFEVAEPLAVGEQRRLGVLVRSFSVIPERPGRDLRALLGDPALERAQRRPLLESFGALQRRLHDCGVDQDDTSPNNFLVRTDGGWVLIDFERCRLGAALSEPRRLELLAKLQRHGLGVSRSDRLRALRAYLGGDAGAAERRALWEKIGAVFVALRRRDARRAADGAFQVGRHVGREGAAWVIRGRESAPVLPLDLPEAEARDVWVRAQQLERLALPALRPVRLAGRRVELEQANEVACADPARAIQRARRELERFGELAADAAWVFTAEGARLRDPRAFRLR